MITWVFWPTEILVYIFDLCLGRNLEEKEIIIVTTHYAMISY